MYLLPICNEVSRVEPRIKLGDVKFSGSKFSLFTVDHCRIIEQSLKVVLQLNSGLQLTGYFGNEKKKEKFVSQFLKFFEKNQRFLGKETNLRQEKNDPESQSKSTYFSPVFSSGSHF